MVVWLAACIFGWMDGSKVGLLAEWMDVCLAGWLVGWMDVCLGA
jgi:hypothetical protein